jgi:prepilin-type processing-associated H-X9-DG protein
MDLDFELDTPAGKVGPTKPQRRRISIIELMAVLAILSVLIALVLPAVRAAREAARRAQCACNFCGILLALHNYHSAYDTFPPAYIADANGRRMHSWRVLILPWIEQKSLYDQYNFSEPWDGPNNIKLLDQMPRNFACPSWHDYTSSSTTLTSYVAMTGPGTIFPVTGSTKLADVLDGTRNTLIVVEVANMNIPWTAPKDLDVRTMSYRVNDPRRPGISSKHPGGANVGFADGSTRFLRESIVPGTLRSLFTIAGGEAISADEALPSK